MIYHDTDISILHGDYKPTYSWGVPPCMYNEIVLIMYNLYIYILFVHSRYEYSAFIRFVCQFCSCTTGHVNSPIYKRRETVPRGAETGTPSGQPGVTSSFTCCQRLEAGDSRGVMGVFGAVEQWLLNPYWMLLVG